MKKNFISMKKSINLNKTFTKMILQKSQIYVIMLVLTVQW